MKRLTMLYGKRPRPIAFAFLVFIIMALRPIDSFGVTCDWSVAVEVLRYSDPAIRPRPEWLSEFSWIMLAEVDSCAWFPTEGMVGGDALPGDRLMYRLRPIVAVKGAPPTEPVWAMTGFITFHNGMCQDTSADVYVALEDSVLQANSPYDLRVGGVQ